MMKVLNLFNPRLPSHLATRKLAKQLCRQINAIPVQQLKQRQPLYQQLFGAVSSAFIEPDFFCDYGKNIFIGEDFFANHHCVMLDAAAIHIGARVLLGPAVHLYTTTHPIDAKERAAGMQMIAPIRLEDDCWIGGHSVVMPGISIGARSVIGAGSVVTQDIPPDVVAAGNPCRVIRSIS
ncbi:sugar O-acetyltransferase [Undibacterium sp. Jales W-56]|uniref:sugar O-acetyltransferase n=1 Tax=Undibacterium sp. Jales W-56 TaxID=2897325 RepID=UPI0021D10FB1|nr:sugar O-acetyltransferase [Undibacterium sp. Jales W-56]MCU6433576.1 sugar O-acetyltransferase [Undibacterium sp. Jales W-56]